MPELAVFSPERIEAVRIEHLASVLGCRVLIARFPGSDVDRDRAAAWIKKYLAEFAGARVQDVVLEKTSDGKPFWAGSDVHFSVSHSGPLWALALRRASPVGVDIETWRESSRLRKIAARFFTPDENESLARLSGDPEFTRASLTMWTRKEASAKRRGTGILAELAAPRGVDRDPSVELWTQAVDFEFVLSLAVGRNH